MKQTIGIIGSGKIGRGIIQRLLACGLYTAPQIWISATSPQREVELKTFFPACHVTQSLTEICDNAAIVVLAVRPQVFEEVAETLNGKLTGENHLVISIITGRSRQQLSKQLGTQRLARCTATLLLHFGWSPSHWFCPELSFGDLCQIASIGATWGDCLIDCSTERQLEEAIVRNASGLAIVAETLVQLATCSLDDKQAEEANFVAALSMTEGLINHAKDIGLAGMRDLIKRVQTKGGVTEQFFEASHLATNINAGFTRAMEHMGHMFGTEEVVILKRTG